MTLRWRITLILALVALAVAAFAALASYLSTESQLRSGIDETLKSRAAAVNTPNNPPGDPRHGDRGGPPRPDGDSGCPDPGAFQPASGAQLVSADGTVTSHRPESNDFRNGVHVPIHRPSF